VLIACKYEEIWNPRGTRLKRVSLADRMQMENMFFFAEPALL
jgi:hypothetical protein